MRFHTSTPFIAAITLCLAACGTPTNGPADITPPGGDPSGDPGISIGGENGNCETISQTPLTDLDTVVGEFSRTPRELLDDLTGNFEDNAGPADAEATLSLQAIEDPILVEQAGVNGAELVCPSFLAFEADAVFTLGDGRLDEVRTTMVRLYGDTQGSFTLAIPADDVVGNIDVPTESDVTGETPDTVTLLVSGHVADVGAWTGEVRWQLEFDDGMGADATVSATNEPSEATWSVIAAP